MQPPDELMVDELLPALRQLVAKKLRQQGYSQNMISRLLGVTQASVSLYLASDTRGSYRALEALSLPPEEADRCAALLAEDAKRSAVDALGTLYATWKGLLGRGAICERHRKLYPVLADCDVCMREFGGVNSEFSEGVEEVAEALKRVEAAEGFAQAMPEVSVNLALAVGEARTASDIVAVPGRIVKVRGRPRATLPPEPGASRHLAQVLLLVRTRMPEVRACINLRYDSKIASVLKRLRLRLLTIGGYRKPTSEDPTVGALRSRLTTMRESFDVLVDVGGSGVEPNIYIFGKSAGEAVDTALMVSTAYAKA